MLRIPRNIFRFLWQVRELSTVVGFPFFPPLELQLVGKFLCFFTVPFKSSSLTMLNLSKTDRVLWPEIFMATTSETPARFRFQTPGHSNLVRQVWFFLDPIAALCWSVHPWVDLDGTRWQLRHSRTGGYARNSYSHRPRKHSWDRSIWLIPGCVPTRLKWDQHTWHLRTLAWVLSINDAIQNTSLAGTD